jgi:hypothetical protein
VPDRHLFLLRSTACLLLCLAAAAPAAAQQKEPIGPFAIDFRGAFTRHKAEPSVATDLGVVSANLPSRTFGLVAGAHVYPLRSAKVTLGLGGNLVISRGSRQIDVLAADGKTTTKSPVVRRHFRTFSPEVSLNFGHRNGWSYISGGMFGRSKLYLDREDAPAAASSYRATVNYGGGARWFNRDHVAFAVDFRWYSVAEQPASAGVIAQPRTTLLVLSGGISIK